MAADTFTLEDLRKHDAAPAQPQTFTLEDLHKAAPKEVRSPAYMKGRAEDDPLQRAVGHLINGPTFGFGDEIMGAALALPHALVNKRSIPDAYRDMRDYTRGIQDQYKEDFPIAAPVTQLAAAAPLLTVNPLGTAARLAAPGAAARFTQWSQAPRAGAAALGTRMATAGLSGGSYGALTGVGESTADDIYGLGLDAGKGFLTGASLSAAVPMAGSLAMGGYNQAATRLPPVDRIGQALGARPAVPNYARQKVAEALVRDARGEVFESGASNAGSQAAARFRKLGPEARVVDAGGQNTHQLLDTVATLPGRTKNLVENAIHDRQAGRGARMIGAADDALNVNGARMASSIDDWIAQRRLNSSPLYARLRGMAVEPSDELRSIVEAAERLGAGREARRIATAERLPYTLRLEGDRGTPLLFPAQRPSWSMQDLDLLKRGLDDIILQNTDEAGRATALGASVTGLNHSLKQELDRLTQGADGTSLYQQARAAFAGPSVLIDASRRGRRAFNQDEAAIRQAMNGLDGSELDAFRLGAFEGLRAKLGKMGGQTEIMNMWRDGATREKLQAIFGDERSYRQFAAAAAREARLKGLESVGRGSQTAARQFGAGDLDTAPLEAAASVVTSPSVGALGSLLRAWNRVQTPEGVRDEMGRLLLSRDPITMRDLETLAPLLSAERSRRAATAGAFGGLLAN